jgi:molybdate transport system substrate-binding protein
MTLRILSTVGVRGALTALFPELEQHTGSKIDISFGTAAVFRKEIEEGREFDVAILTKSAISDLAAAGSIDASSVSAVARSRMGLAMRKNAPKPDIGSVDNLKQTLLAADSIASSKTGLAGIYFSEVLSELGIASQIEPKIRLETSGGFAAQLIVTGDAQLAVQLVSEILPVRGVELAGVFPDVLQRYGVFSAGVGSRAKEPSSAAAFTRYLTDPSLEALFTSWGLERQS